MATKAERFRAAVERSRPRPPRADLEKPQAGRTVSRATHSASKATFKLETTVGHARPSRKSTRKAANRVKPDSNLELRQKNGTLSPKARARRASVRQETRIEERVARRAGLR